MAPPLHCRFENGFVYGYVPGIPLKHLQISSPEYFPLIARKMARWHQVDTVPGDRSPRFFKTLWKWMKNIPKHSAKLKTVDMDFLETELAALEIRIKALNCPVVFCHNDLLSANIIYSPEINEVSFIDYEYGSFNYRSFDIANHFCEFAGFDCDYSLYPDEEFQRQWCKEYLKCFSDNFTDQQIDQVLKEVAVFTLAAHFSWGLWGLVQAQVSDIQFDYTSYAAKRFAEYKRRYAML